MKFWQTLALSFLASAIFGFVDIGIAMAIDEHFESYFAGLAQHDPVLTSIIMDITSTASALLLFSYVHHWMHDKFHLIDHPVINSIGFIIGSLFIVGIYIVSGAHKKHIIQSRHD